MAFLIGGANSAADTGYDIDNSLRFNDDDSAYLSRTPGSAGDTKKFTVSFWVKRSALGTYQDIFHEYPGSAQRSQILFRSDDTLHVELEAANLNKLQTTRVFRDVSAWYHIVVVYDSDNGTSGNRVILYVNGVRETSFSTETYPSSGAVSGINGTTQHEISSYDGGGYFIDGYLADVYVIDGTAYAASDFGETDEDSGIWKPKDAKDDLTFGTNGFYLEFKQTGTDQDASGIGADTSGEDNHWAVTNLAATDQCTDTPTNNFATLNPLVYNYAGATLSEGNVKILTGSSENSFVTNTIAPSNGKWYTEIKVTDVGSDALLGITKKPVPVGPNHYPGEQAYDVAYYSGGHKAIGTSFSSYGDSYTTNDIIGIAMDLDNDKVYFAKNNTWQDSGDPTSGATGTGAISIPSLSGFDDVFIAAGEWNGSDTSTFELNFGNPSFSISSGNADANGYGNFEYAPPSGYYALCTKNLAEYG